MRSTRAKILTAAAACLLLGLTVAVKHQGAEAEDSAARDAPSVVGVVKFDGPRPKRKPIQLTEKDGKQSDCHKLHEKGLLGENLIVGEQGGLANVFVHVKKGLEKNTYPTPKEPAVLNQQHCMFRPRVQGILVGQQFLMRNSDPLIHNVRALSFRNRPFNIAQPANSPDRTKVFTRKEGAVTIQCDLHPWMTAYVFVMDHPYFAVSDAKGRFQIAGLPPGDYTLEAWHEELGKQEVVVTVGASGAAKVKLAFQGKAANEQGVGELTTHEPEGSAGPPELTSQRPFVKMWKTADLAAEAAILEGRSLERGSEVFKTAACYKCHVIAGKGTKLGPDLTEVSKRFQGAKLLEQIINPSSEIHKDYQTYNFLTKNGKVISGLVVKEDTDAIHVLPNPLKPEEVTVIPKPTLEERAKSPVSMMPKDLLATFEKEEILDLLSFLQAGAKATHEK